MADVKAASPGRTVITGTCPHGKLLFAAVNEPSVIKHYAQGIAQMAMRGFLIERVPAPIRLGGDCPDCQKSKETANV
jgi:hypothetical protein